MKKIVLGSVMSMFAAGSAVAGGMAEPIMEMEPEMIEAAASSSSAGLIIPLILLALIALAMSSAELVD